MRPLRFGPSAVAKGGGPASKTDSRRLPLTRLLTPSARVRQIGKVVGPLADMQIISLTAGYQHALAVAVPAGTHSPTRPRLSNPPREPALRPEGLGADPLSGC